MVTLLGPPAVCETAVELKQRIRKQIIDTKTRDIGYSWRGCPASCGGGSGTNQSSVLRARTRSRRGFQDGAQRVA